MLFVVPCLSVSMLWAKKKNNNNHAVTIWSDDCKCMVGGLDYYCIM